MVNIVLLLLLRVFLCIMQYGEGIGDTVYSLAPNEVLTKYIPRSRYRSSVNNTVFLKQSFTGTVHARLVTPSVLGNFDYFSSYRTTIDGRYLYICGYSSFSSIYVVDISDITTPILVGKIDRLPEGGGACHLNSFLYHNDFLYLAAGSYGYSLINVEDRKNPRFVDTFRFIVYDTRADTTSLTLLPPYLLASDGRDGLKIIDVSNATGPQLYHSIPPVENGTGRIYSTLMLRDNTVLGLGTEKGFYFYNFTTMKAPIYISKYVNNPHLGSMRSYCNEKYIFTPFPSSLGVYAIDIKNISNPRHIGYMSSIDYVYGFAVDGDTGYFGTKNHKLHKVNITDPKNANILYTTTFSGNVEHVRNLELFNSNLIASLHGSGFEIFNVSTNLTSVFFPNGKNMISEAGDRRGYAVGGRSIALGDVFERIVVVAGSFFFDLFEFREGLLNFKSRMYYVNGSSLQSSTIRILNHDYLVRVSGCCGDLGSGIFVYNISDMNNPLLIHNDSRTEYRGAVAEYIRHLKFLVIGYASTDETRNAIIVNVTNPVKPSVLSNDLIQASSMGYEESEKVLYIFSQEVRPRIYAYNFTTASKRSLFSAGIEEDINNPQEASYNKYYSTLYVRDGFNIEPLSLTDFKRPEKSGKNFDDGESLSTSVTFLHSTGKTMIMGMTTTSADGDCKYGIVGAELETRLVSKTTGRVDMVAPQQGMKVRDNVVYTVFGELSLNVIRFDYEVVDSGKCGVGKIHIQAFTDDSSEGILNDTITVTKTLTCVHGYCGNEGICVCDDSYKGDTCNEVDSFLCYGKLPQDLAVCDGHGKCISNDKCECESTYSGRNCETDDLVTIIATVIVSTALGVPVLIAVLIAFLCLCCVFSCGLCIFCCGLCVIFILLIGMCVFCCFSGCGSCVYMRTKRKMSKFKELKNFDLLLAEQKAEDDHSIAKIKIDKNLYAIPYDEIQLEKVLGEGGSNSVVYKVKWRGQVAAFKCFKTRHVMGTQDDYDEFEREVTVMGNVNHPHILQFMGCCLDPPRIGIMMEFCEKGDLRVFLMTIAMSTGLMYPFIEKLRMCLEMSQAIDYLHSRQIIHRDLKLENVLVTKSESTKLMDFGLSRRVERISMVKTKSIGTSFYIAPEVITSNTYNEKCDVFSFSIMLYIIFSEEYYPYGVESMNTELKVAQDPSFRPSLEKLNKVLPEDYTWISDVVEKNWGHEPAERNSFSELVAVLSEKQVFFDTKNKEKLEEEGEDEEESGEKTIENELVEQKKLVELLKMELMEKEREIEVNKRELERKDQKIKELEEKYVYKKLFEKKEDEGSERYETLDSEISKSD